MFVVCGEALYDLFAAEGSEGLSFDARIGGSPFNVAVGLARLNQDAALLTGISLDRLGHRLLSALERETVSTGLLRRKEAPTTLSLVDLGPDGTPIYTFYGTGAADSCLMPDDLPTLNADVWGLHFGSYSLVVEPTGGSLLGLARREARRRLITLDPNVRLNVEPDLDTWRTRIDAFAACADLVKVSEEDLYLLYQGEDPERVARRWLDAGAALVIVSAGAKGAIALTDARRVSVPADDVRVVDTVGAGDAFQVALIAALAECGCKTRDAVTELEESTLRTLLCFAASAAAVTCGRRGANLPHRVELKNIAKESF